MIKSIKTSTELLLFLVNDMLDVYMLKNGKLQPIYERVRFKEILEEVHQMFAIEAKAKKLEFGHCCTVDVPPILEIDKRRYKQILVNLISNALKFTNTGSIIVHVDFEADKKLVKTTVADTGIGIKKSD